MILTCPECSTRYALDSALLEPKGRRVRCTECAAIWFEEPETPEIPPPIPSSLEDIPQSVRPLPEAVLLPQSLPSKRLPVVAGIAAGVALAGLLAAGTGWGAVEKRDFIARLWPPSVLIFESAGFRIPVPGEGLVFDQVQADLVGTPEAGATLSVTGKIINMTGATLPLPILVASLSGREDPVPAAIWTEALPISEIEGEASFAFKITHAVQESDGDTLTLRFSDGEIPEGFQSVIPESPPSDAPSPPHEKTEGH